MKKSLAVLFLLLVFTTVAPCCDLDLTQSPQLRGMRLGMLRADILKTYPSLKVTAPTTFLGAIDLRSIVTFENVATVLISFDKSDRVDSLAISYLSIQPIETLNQFTETVADSLGLPNSPREWSVRNRTFSATLPCNGFSVTVDEDAKSITLEIDRPAPQAKPFKP